MLIVSLQQVSYVSLEHLGPKMISPRRRFFTLVAFMAVYMVIILYHSSNGRGRWKKRCLLLACSPSPKPRDGSDAAVQWCTRQCKAPSLKSQRYVFYLPLFFCR